MLFLLRRKIEEAVRLFVLLHQVYRVASATLETIHTGPLYHVQVVEGARAEFPCDISTPDPSDKVLLVLWFKDSIGSSIYTYESRKNGRMGSRDWSDEKTIGGRAHFDLNSSPSALIIEKIKSRDEGLYRCRVDFKKSPTRHSRTNLTVIIPPKDPPVIKERGVQVWSTIGPYDEGDSLHLVCEIIGGRPPPHLHWWLRKQLIDDDYTNMGNRVVRNSLTISNLSREHLHAPLSCQASNSNSTAPKNSMITIEMNFKPLAVRFLGSREPLSAGKYYELECQSVGARPPAVISWLLDGMPLTNVTSKTTNSGNVTLSVVHFTPREEDRGRLLTCSAASPVIEHEPLTDNWELEIYYKPILNLRLGLNLDPDIIKEGDDVYFECKVRANPWVYKITWSHQGSFVHHNVSAGVIISNQSLVIQRVMRQQAGLYTCIASNIEGDGESNALKLNVQYIPVCAENQVQIYGAARFEKVTVICKLDSVPPVTSFTWRFNNSGDISEIGEGHVLVNGQESSLSYVAKTELDYGTLLCWGRNSLGKQRHPCNYIVIPAGPPDPPSNCSAVNETANVLHVKCIPGYDGGLEQSFIAEVYDDKTHELRINVSENVTPNFKLTGLEPGKAFTVFVYSLNSKGSSRKWSINAYTIQDVAEKRTAQVGPPPDEDLPITPILAVGVGIAGSLLLIILVAVVILRLNMEKRKARAKESPVSLHTPVIDIKDTEESNPDVIPNGGSEQEEKIPTTPEEGGFKSAQICGGVPQFNSKTTIPCHMYTSLPRTRAQTQLSCQIPNPDVMYAELAFPRLHYSTGSLSRRKPNPIVYAQIDHNLSPQDMPSTSAVLSSMSPIDSSSPIAGYTSPIIHSQPHIQTTHVTMSPTYNSRDSSLIPAVSKVPLGISHGPSLPYHLQDGVPVSLGISNLRCNPSHSQMGYEGIIPPPALTEDDELNDAPDIPLMSDPKESSV